MKKVIAYLIAGLVLLGSCSVKNVEAQNADFRQLIIGTWKCTDGITWVFNADGKLLIDNAEFKYNIINSKLAVARNVHELIIWDVSISSNGNEMFFERTGLPMYGVEIGRNRQRIDGDHWLTKN